MDTYSPPLHEILQTFSYVLMIHTSLSTGPVAMAAICKSICACKSSNGNASSKPMRRVLLSDCFTGRPAEEMYASLKCLEQIVVTMPLQELDLGDNALSMEGAKILAPFIAKCASLSILRLNNTGIRKNRK